MKKINLIALGFFIVFNLYAEDNKANIDKLDVLDKQSREFFNAITGLEKTYLEEQVNAIKSKKDETTLNPNQNINTMPGTQIIKEEPKLSQEDYEKNVFTHQNEMARLTTDFTRTKKLKDLKIKSMYSFNGKDYVVLSLIEETAQATKMTELSANIEGRYIEGDSILGHKIIDINTRTKSVELYKKLDEEYGYTIYLSNYGISVSDLTKIPKVEVEKKANDKKVKNEIKENLKEEAKNAYKEEFPIKKAFEQVQTDKKLNTEEVSNCLYVVKKANLNVRNSSDINAKILRILKVNDQFTIKQKNSDWAQIGTIYKKISGDVMDVSEQNNWVQILEETVTNSNSNCM
ncbi:MAG: hypothetical protein U5K55_05695 [Aliarcobacter sp.]|nr:hypothetical protein [Aliarcobacter sp.]